MNDWAYFDYAATTPIDSEVLDIYLKNLRNNFANPSAVYDLGLNSRELLENSRAKIAEVLGVLAAEIIFLSGATEADNLALKGYLFHRDNKSSRLITSPTEHKAILDTAAFCATQGVKVELLKIYNNGEIDLNHLEELLKKSPALVSVMAVNNETGITQPLSEISKLCQKYGAKFHIDAAQASGRIKLDLNEWGADAVSLCAHKVYAPKGIGLLFTKRFPKFRLNPQIHGGGQERNLRSGTNAVALASAFAFALEKFSQNLEVNNQKVWEFREKILANLPTGFSSNLNEDLKNFVPHILSLNSGKNFKELLPLANSHKIALSAGSACNADFFSGSHALKAMEIKNPEFALRISLSHLTNNEEVERLLEFFNSIKQPITQL